MVKKTKTTNTKTKRKPLWWTRLPIEEQMKYLKEHPRSKLKPSIKRVKKLPKDVDAALEKHSHDIVNDLKHVIDKADNDWENNLAKMDPKEVKEIESQIKEAMKEEPTTVDTKKPKRIRNEYDDDDDWGAGRSRRVAATIMLATKIGILTVGAGALLAVNPNYVFLMPMLAKKMWDAIPDGSIQTGLALYMGHRMLKSMKQSLDNVKKDTRELREAVVEAQPTKVAPVTNKSVEVGHYSHYTDLIKSLGKIEQEKIQLNVSHLEYQTHPLNKLAASLYLLYKVEAILPNLSNMLMMCNSENVSLKPRIKKNVLDFIAIRMKLKTDIATLSNMLQSDGHLKFHNKLMATIKSHFPKLKISYSRSAIFNAEEGNQLQLVHCYEFKVARGNVTLYVNTNKLSYSIERSKEFTPVTLIPSTITGMLTELKFHLAEVLL